MLILLVFYAICASAVLVWSTLLAEGRDFRFQRYGLRHVAISDYMLMEWAAGIPNLVILDVHRNRGIGGWDELASCWLPISIKDVPSLLELLPPASMVVFCCREATEQLDSRSKTALAQTGIGTVYFLESSAIFPTNHCCEIDLPTRFINRGLRKITMSETRLHL